MLFNFVGWASVALLYFIFIFCVNTFVICADSLVWDRVIELMIIIIIIILILLLKLQ